MWRRASRRPLARIHACDVDHHEPRELLPGDYPNLHPEPFRENVMVLDEPRAELRRGCDDDALGGAPFRPRAFDLVEGLEVVVLSEVQLDLNGDLPWEAVGSRRADQ